MPSRLRERAAGSRVLFHVTSRANSSQMLRSSARYAVSIEKATHGLIRIQRCSLCVLLALGFISGLVMCVSIEYLGFSPKCDGHGAAEDPPYR
ncbi:hypothetical protein BJX66DRAFT_316629 [Aspergillus keveii]|uniref:Uncharacterized protein n=1 Tax=Aspergillus keveii TaxID=714993 RepID=A0ABR4FMI7_9EURO